MQVVQQGDKVRVHYVKCFQDGSAVSSRDKAPIELTIGIDHPRLPGLGLALVGLAIGERKILVVPALQAYGAYDPSRIRRLARTRFAEHQALAVGQWVRAWDRRRRRRLVRIVELRKNMVVVDTNHRWAGQSLELEVEVLSIDGPGTISGTETHGYAADLDCAHSDERQINLGGQE
jgi:FKBP-type peptidyl-prolyl cis-trans isomerase 2